ncbi:MAG: hypothetical protein RIS52_626 [Pseudomonadota bacterium]|jgi:ubiquinone/menaquinone biosynthesis C-methylase UbiE
MRALCLAGLILLAGCKTDAAPQFPKAERGVAPIVSSRWSTEESRDRRNEADKIMDLSGVSEGMTVADIGAGEGYYTIRMAARVGPKGRVVAEDIMTDAYNALAQRVLDKKLQNVSVKRGTPDDPGLPAGSFDRILMVHMYHEIAEPYAFLWHLRPALRRGGRVIIVDADRATNDHGTPPLLLQCEFAALGYKMVEFREAAFAGGYLATFEAVSPRPEPSAIRACALARAGK